MCMHTCIFIERYIYIHKAYFYIYIYISVYVHASELHVNTCLRPFLQVYTPCSLSFTFSLLLSSLSKLAVTNFSTISMLMAAGNKVRSHLSFSLTLCVSMFDPLFFHLSLQCLSNRFFSLARLYLGTGTTHRGHDDE